MYQIYKLVIFFSFAAFIAVLSHFNFTAASNDNSSSVNLSNMEIDYKPFHNIIKRLLTSSQKLELHCNIPSSAIVFTYASAYMMPLILMQQDAMSTWNDSQHCLKRSYIVICLDLAGFDVCRKHNILNCVLIQTPIILPPSDFQNAAYSYFTYIKHEFMFEALKVAQEVFFIDADTLLFRNPWTLDNNHGLVYDIMWQRRRGRIGQGCSGSVNSGQMYIHNSSKVFRYFSIMRAKKDTILKGVPGKTDQDFVLGAVVSANLSYCELETDKFTSYCRIGNKNFVHQQTPLQQLITFHAACVEGLNSKIRIMKAMLALMKQRNQSNTIETFVSRLKSTGS